MIELPALKKRSLILCTLMTVIASGCSDHPAAPGSGYVRITVATTGGDRDDGYEVKTDSISRFVGRDGTLVLPLPVGTHSVELRDIAANCILDGPAVRSLEVAADAEVEVSFTVECAETGVRVEIRATGQDAPPRFELIVFPGSVLTVDANSTRSITRLVPGSVQLRLNLRAHNCSVIGDSIFAVDVVNREVREVLFQVGCTYIPRTGPIVFADNETLTLMSADGSGQRRLSRGIHPSWSRDGTKIAYADLNCDDTTELCSGSLAILDPLTGEVAHHAAAIAGWYPVWSPLEDAVAYTGANTSEFLLYDIANSTVTKIIDNVYGRHPSWSPDAKHLVAACWGPGMKPGAVICRFNRDGADLRVLTSGIYDVDPAWSPDGTRITFTREGDGPSAIMGMNPDGTDLVKLAEGRRPAWAPDSRQIVFERDSGLFLMNADGTEIRKLTDGFHRAPAWRR